MTHNLGSVMVHVIVWSLGAILSVPVGGEFVSIATVDEGAWGQEITWQYRVDPSLVQFVRVEVNPESRGTLTATSSTVNNQLVVGCRWTGTQMPIPAQPLGWVYWKALKPTSAAGVKLIVENGRVDGIVSEMVNEDQLVIRGTPRLRFTLGTK